MPADVTMTVTVVRDGSQWCARIGGDLQEGVGGFGDTPREALAHLSDMMERTHRWPAKEKKASWRATFAALLRFWGGMAFALSAVQFSIEHDPFGALWLATLGVGAFVLAFDFAHRSDEG